MKRALDTIATVLVIALSATLLWALVARPKPAVVPPVTGTAALQILPKEPVSIDDTAREGSPNAPVVIVESSDFQCPYCGTFARDVLPELRRTFVQSGQVLMASRHLPIEKLHPFALAAAAGASCAGEQKKFWQMHDLLFGAQDRLERKFLVSHAESIGLNQARFLDCLDSSQTGIRIRQDLAEATKHAVAGTPTFFIGSREADGRVRVAERLGGAKPLSQFREAIARVLTKSALPSR